MSMQDSAQKHRSSCKAGVTGVVTVILKSEPFLKDCISSFETFEWVERRQFHTFY